MKGLKEKLSRMVSDIFNCHCIQALPFNFVSRQFNDISVRLHVTKKKIREVRITFLALTSFAVPGPQFVLSIANETDNETDPRCVPRCCDCQNRTLSSDQLGETDANSGEKVRR